ncbi:hypothetical protein F5877DRAFT_70113 [Lentinula edodes]|nr:hypothetical protein F5877DRAFT_70113 [Lentinula edodes]
MLLPRVAKFLAQRCNFLRVPKTVTRRRRKTTAMAPGKGRVTGRRNIVALEALKRVTEERRKHHPKNSAPWPRTWAGYPENDSPIHAGGRKLNHGGENHPRTLPGQEHRQGEHEEEHVPIHAGGRKPNHGDERHRRTLPGREQQHGQGGEVDHAHGGPGDEGENNAMEDGKKHGDRNVHLAVGSRRIRERERINNIVVQVARTSRTKSRVKKLLGPMIANLSVEGMKAKPRMGRRLPQASVNYGADLIE